MTIETRTQWFKSSYSGGNNNTCVEARWFTSSHSTANGANCVEARLVGGGIEIRDSKYPDGAILQFGSRVWARFVRGLDG